MAAISIASAGQIEIGAGNSSGVTTSGLTTAYVGAGAGVWAEKPVYTATLFGGATSVTGGTLNGVAETSSVGTGTGSSMPNYQSGFQQFTDTNAGVTFGMLDDGANGNNLWASGNGSTTGATSIIVPVNVTGVNEAYILLNDYFGVSGSTYQVVFNYVGGASDTFNLTAGVNIDDATECGTAAGDKSPTWTGAGNCTTYVQSTSSPNTDGAFTANYANTSTNTSPYSGTSGTLDLEDLSFNVAAFSGNILGSITITEGNNVNDGSRLGLSGITVAGTTESLTPEPSTVVLLLAGLGVMAFLGQRRKARL
jgi:hypothetical protein